MPSRAAAMLMLLACLATAPGRAEPGRVQRDGEQRDREQVGGQRLAILALHDVADRPELPAEDGVSTERLVAFFDWLAGNGWTAVTLDDIERATSGQSPLPPRAVLITIDDGYASLYSRVFPLALAYRMPVVAAVVGSWLDVPADGRVAYGDQWLPRSRFITWEQAREMQASGLVEFASHSDDLHHGIVANPQGNRLPAAVTRRYDAAGGYESSRDNRARLQADLRRSRERMLRELGRAPRALVWPYGRYNRDAVEVAHAAGFRMALSLTPEPAEVTTPMALGRQLVWRDLELGSWVSNLRFLDPWPRLRRIVGVDPAMLDDADPAVANERLGRVIERLVALGATHIVVDAAVPSVDGGLQASWFPTEQMPMRRDLLSRIAAQVRARAGAQVIVRLPHRRALRTLGDAARVTRLFADLAVNVPLDALLVEQVPGLSLPAVAADAPWDVRGRRDRFNAARLAPEDALALHAFAEVEAARPDIELVWLAPPGHSLAAPSALAEVTLVSVDEAGMREIASTSKLDPATARRVGLWWASDVPPDARKLAAAVRAFQVRGGTIVGWDTDDPLRDSPAAAALSPTVSSAAFPPRSVMPP